MDTVGKIQSVDRASLVIKLLAKKESSMKLTEIAEELDINKSTLHGIISTLKYHGFIDQDKETQKYRLGMYLAQLGNIVIKSLDIRTITSPIIADVCEKISETVHIGALDGHEVVYVDKKESNQSMRIFTNIGARNPAYCTGVGKAMLAYSDEDTLSSRLSESLMKFTDNTITDKNVLLEELRTIKNDGIAFDNEEYIEGLTCVAAPIFDGTGRARYAISISGPTIRMNKQKIREAIYLVKEAAKKISEGLGYRV
ncbi:IclR family transcriptional regulator [Sedimentibacter hydroxybenzoicus DSM 7310]|uniref:Glycerol operon regulatory protein n=1 Tax=Sedimentibacter hydroxybenzoicus DSM 7310 TaxID=1123245 RepID=A0A974BM18_SEDHY|nr:IclR family transcriptional regulator [Sedimentibacter hydroxybenzoicus]NYB75065.1 IclR family transcriptional regulator [Sedimentibacter hydroxybenzoicus DSM 7310]